MISGDWRKSSLPVQVVEREESFRGECAEREELARLTVGGGGREVGFRKSELVNYRRASGPALFRPLQTTESHPPRRTVQLHSELPSLNQPSSTAARSSLYPTSSTLTLRESSIDREKQDITKTTSVRQTTQPLHQPQDKDGSEQPMKRQDSGIETLASSSVTHL